MGPLIIVLHQAYLVELSSTATSCNFARVRCSCCPYEVGIPTQLTVLDAATTRVRIMIPFMVAPLQPNNRAFLMDSDHVVNYYMNCIVSKCQEWTIPPLDLINTAPELSLWPLRRQILMKLCLEFNRQDHGPQRIRTWGSPTRARNLWYKYNSPCLFISSIDPQSSPHSLSGASLCRILRIALSQPICATFSSLLPFCSCNPSATHPSESLESPQVTISHNLNRG